MSLLRQLRVALVSGFRSIIFLRPRAGAFDLTLGATVLLCVLSLATLAACEWMQGETGAAFRPEGLASNVGYFAILIAVLSALPLRRFGVPVNRMFVGIVSSGFAFSACYYAVLAIAGSFVGKGGRDDPEMLVTLGLFAQVAALALLVLSTFAIDVRLGYALASRRHMIAGLCAAFAALVSAFALPIRPLVASPTQPPLTFSIAELVLEALPIRRSSAVSDAASAEAADTPRIDGELVMMRQPEMLGKALAGLRIPTSDRGNLFLIGMAPYGEQEVFRREITAVQALFDKRFGTDGRSMLLSNNVRTTGDIPLASMTNLTATLKHVGGMLRPEKDVLVLFITSHGDEGVIAVSAPTLPLRNIRPRELRRALDEAGIVNRVLVLSACHAGSFIEPLRDANTIIVAAAAADKTSFGCGNEFEWTYFGDAFFNHALRSETSIVDAFYSAKRLVSQWEKERGISASDPQISVGSTIGARIDDLLRERVAEAGAEAIR